MMALYSQLLGWSQVCKTTISTSLKGKCLKGDLTDFQINSYGSGVGTDTPK